jgi:hypothetical protein
MVSARGRRERQPGAGPDRAGIDAGQFGGGLRRAGAAPLGARAIPAWLAFDTAGDLYANWSWPLSRAGLMGSTAAYVLTPDTPVGHPLTRRDDAVDFYRVEGTLGRPLGSTWSALLQQKQALGLTFGIDWVLVPTGTARDAADRELALALTRRLLACRMRELDVMFLTLMAGLFAFMVWLVRTLGPLDARKALQPKAAAAPAGMAIRALAMTAAAPVGVAGLRLTPITLDLQAELALNTVSEQALSKLRKAATATLHRPRSSSQQS